MSFQEVRLKCSAECFSLANVSDRFGQRVPDLEVLTGEMAGRVPRRFGSGVLV